MKPSESQTKIQKNNSQDSRKLKLRQRLLLILLPLALTIGGVVILWRLLDHEKKSPPSTTVQKLPLSVKVVEVKAGNVKESSEFIASLQSLRSTSIQANTEGKVSQIFIKKGSQVQAQTPLLKIETKNQPANLNSNKTITLQDNQQQLQNARIQLQELESQKLLLLQNIRLKQQQYEKYSNLAIEGAISRQTKDEYAQKLEVAKTEFKNLDNKIQIQQATVSKLEKAFQQAQLKTVDNIVQTQRSQKNQQYKINAPFSGIITNISVKVGDLVKPSTRVATVTQNKPLEVDIPVSVEKKSQLRRGMLVELINTKNENIGNAKVFFISPEVDVYTNTILVKALFDNEKGKMESGHFAKAKINWNQHSGLLIPTQAVFNIGGKTFVYVAEKMNINKDNTRLLAKKKQVKLGEVIDKNYQVIEGLQPGEKVIVSKLLNLKDGEIVTVQ